MQMKRTKHTVDILLGSGLPGDVRAWLEAQGIPAE